MLTRLQCSAELIEQWAEECEASREAADILMAKALAITHECEDEDPRDFDLTMVEAIRTLIHAARFAGTSLTVLPSCLLAEVRIAKKLGQPWSYNA